MINLLLQIDLGEGRVQGKIRNKISSKRKRKINKLPFAALNFQKQKVFEMVPRFVSSNRPSFRERNSSEKFFNHIK